MGFCSVSNTCVRAAEGASEPARGPRRPAAAAASEPGSPSPCSRPGIGAPGPGRPQLPDPGAHPPPGLRSVRRRSRGCCFCGCSGPRCRKLGRAAAAAASPERASAREGGRRRRRRRSGRSAGGGGGIYKVKPHCQTCSSDCSSCCRCALTEAAPRGPRTPAAASRRAGGGGARRGLRLALLLPAAAT